MIVCAIRYNVSLKKFTYYEHVMFSIKKINIYSSFS